MPAAARSSDQPASDILGRLIALLRRDLKLGPDASIEPETPLLGGPHDLDSLDVLLLLTSVEREFGIRIPNDAVQLGAFRDVDSLARFIGSCRAPAA